MLKKSPVVSVLQDRNPIFLFFDPTHVLPGLKTQARVCVASCVRARLCALQQWGRGFHTSASATPPRGPVTAWNQGSQSVYQSQTAAPPPLLCSPLQSMHLACAGIERECITAILKWCFNVSVAVPEDRCSPGAFTFTSSL